MERSPGRITSAGLMGCNEEFLQDHDRKTAAPITRHVHGHDQHYPDSPFTAARSPY
jgi:hypothetical protein